ncbi:AAA family ATPase [Rhizobium sp. FY34]|uniref:ATP-binding protein n=1 Tax=Rhizobium sp. FY34 TaxID=2562309 RepID=UPI0010C0F5C3|nr:AAA family ATPase [Rhizobium sp. FY34]
MRLRRLDLTRYGKFTDHAIDFGPATPGSPDLHIVYGLNEAGKSTAFSAYLDLLFGIPERSSYNFQHAYNVMQIGGALEFDGREHELVRLKQRANALLDGRGQPVNEALLSSALGGLTRASYRTMFSLDEHTLRDGGEAIVESKGDLGELLFSASAGLADVSRVLSAAIEEAQQFHKKRARNTQLSDLKQQLATLKGEREAIDTYASTYAALVASQVQSEKTYHEVLAELSSARTRQAELNALLRALPLSRELARLEADAENFRDLPRPPRAWAALLPDLMRDETRLQTQATGLERTIERLDAELAEIAVDSAVLSQSDRIAALDDGRARYRTAEDDLPRRRLSLSEKEAALAALLKSLGQEGHGDPSSLVLRTTIVARLRDLIETRSGIAATLRNGERELERTQRLLSDMEQQAEALGSMSGTTGSTRRLESLLSRLNKSDRQARLGVEERGLSQMQAERDRELAALSPWTGDSAALDAIQPVDSRQIAAWRATADDLERRLAGHSERIRERNTRLADIATRLSALQAGGQRLDDETAAILRHEREQAWALHRAALDAATADAFKAALSKDDRLADARLLHASDLAELRQLHQEQHQLSAALSREEEAKQAVLIEQSTLSQAVHHALPFATDGEPTIYRQLSFIETWSGRRKDCLATAASLRQAELRIESLRAELDADLGELRAAVEELGWPLSDRLDLRKSIDLVGDQLGEAITRATEQAGLAKRLADLKRDVIERERALDDAQRSDGEWQAEFAEALSGTWFADESDPSAVRAILDALADLPALVRERDQMSQRIALMERDMQAFAGDVEALRREIGDMSIGKNVLEEADRLAHLKVEAEQNRLRHTTKAEDLASARTEQARLADLLAEHRLRRLEMTSLFGVENLAEVSARMEQAAERDRLERRLTEVREQILAELKLGTMEEAQGLLADVDGEEAARQAAELAERIENLAERSRQVFAELARAKDRVEAVGGDNAVAQLEAKRSTILVEIEDLAIRYLKLRTGTLAAETALSLYREKHRSSMMTRAAQAFRQITRGEYSGLSAQPDKDREILIGVAKDGASKLSDAMSTGTRYQLYLALRLAGYEEFAAVRPSVPFIADDIMETFDELRSEEVFRLFGDMAGLGQVIYLTHHRHLCDIARDVVPGVKIHEL